jgi:hypothetical protein
MAHAVKDGGAAICGAEIGRGADTLHGTQRITKCSGMSEFGSRAIQLLLAKRRSFPSSWRPVPPYDE